MSLKLDKTKVQICMARKGLTSFQLAKIAGVNPNTLNNAVNSGKACKPTTAGKIAEALEVDVTEILTD
jgi:Plasmid maintenance system antidote protein